MKRVSRYALFAGSLPRLTACVSPVVAALALAIATPLSAAQREAVWFEDFEGSGWQEHLSADFGVWEVGTPSGTPDGAHAGAGCLATVLDGYYPDGVHTRLRRHVPFVVPPANEQPRLEFWHWFNFSSSDWGRVEVRPAGGDWEVASATYTHYGSVWTFTSIDLSAYAGQTVEVGFLLHTANYAGGNVDVAQGWYIDDLAVTKGPISPPKVEGFDTRPPLWLAERGVWEWGIIDPESSAAHPSHETAAATVLAGNYYDYQDSRLISPPLLVPALEENPRLRFWHWFNFSSSDSARVEVRELGGDWVQVSPTYTNYSSVWTYPSIDLSAFAGKRVEIGFRFQSANYAGGNVDVAQGWYIDDVEIVSGPISVRNPDDLEAGMGEWNPERGVWEHGVPTSGPGEAYSGQAVFGTVLGGNYYDYQDSRLVSPVLTVPAAASIPRLRFRQWYSFSSSDLGRVEVRRVGEDWQVLSPNYTGTSGGWFYAYLELGAYGGADVQIGFRFQSSNYAGGRIDVSSGWYLDDIVIEPRTAPPPPEAACGDGVDNDGDGLVDCADPDCAAACAPTDPVSFELVDRGDGSVGLLLRAKIGTRGGETGLLYRSDVVRPVEIVPGEDFPGGPGDFFADLQASSNCEGDAAGLVIGWVNGGLGEVLPPGAYELFRIRFEAAPGAAVPACSPLEFVDCLGLASAPVGNQVSDGDSQIVGAVTAAGEVCVRGQGFMRGDANADGLFDITDPIVILGCQFLGEACPQCPDASDVNDDGKLDITDPIYHLEWRFLGGPRPPAPFPACGQDPTDDGLAPCETVKPSC